MFLTFPWTWNMLTTWPIQSVLNEAPFLCAREGNKGILTNCVDTARLVDLVVASLSFLNVWCSPHSQTCLFPRRCVCGTFQFRKTRCAVAILSTMKRRQPFRQKRTRQCASGDTNFLSGRDVQSFEFTPTSVTLKIRRSQK